jgi:hypothetical protein
VHCVARTFAAQRIEAKEQKHSTFHSLTPGHLTMYITQPEGQAIFADAQLTHQRGAEI